MFGHPQVTYSAGIPQHHLSTQKQIGTVTKPGSSDRVLVTAFREWLMVWSEGFMGLGFKAGGFWGAL